MSEHARESDDFNLRVPIGTPVRFWSGARQGEGKVSKTRTRAWSTPSAAMVSVEATREGSPSLTSRCHRCDYESGYGTRGKAAKAAIYHVSDVHGVDGGELRP